MSVFAVAGPIVLPKVWKMLPNAEHINAVLSSIKPKAAKWGCMRAIDADTAQEAAQLAMGPFMAGMPRREAWAEIYSEAQLGGGHSATNLLASLMALIAWDSAADLLDCTPDVLRTMIDLAEPPVCHQATLLLPYALVRFGEEIVQ